MDAFPLTDTTDVGVETQGLYSAKPPHPHPIAQEEDSVARLLTFNQPPRAANDNQLAWGFIPFPEGWYAAC
jgi:hypothetical protein